MQNSAPRRIGYLRVSTSEQNPARQIDGLKDICDHAFIECVSSGAKSRPVYEKAIKSLKSGDTLVIWSLDRAWRSVIEAVTQTEKLHARGINLHIVDMQIDLSTPTGKLFLSIAAAFAEFERNMLRQRTREGMQAARLRGKQIGRPKSLNEAQTTDIRTRITQGTASIQSLAAEYSCSTMTISRVIKPPPPDT